MAYREEIFQAKGIIERKKYHTYRLGGRKAAELSALHRKDTGMEYEKGGEETLSDHIL